LLTKRVSYKNDNGALRFHTNSVERNPTRSEATRRNSTVTLVASLARPTYGFDVKPVQSLPLPSIIVAGDPLLDVGMDSCSVLCSVREYCVPFLRILVAVEEAIARILRSRCRSEESVCVLHVYRAEKEHVHRDPKGQAYDEKRCHH